ncbi:MAG: LysR family transcriptional regulator, partial [Rhodobiaceae bacterium]|nr:LysR family transcriptional regulator [Rhodobiaceae bacterium]
ELGAGRLAILPVQHLPVVRQWFVLHRTDSILSGAMRTVLQEIRDNAAAMIRSDEVDAALGAST